MTSSTSSSITLGLQSRRISALSLKPPSQADPCARAFCHQTHHYTGRGPFAGESLGVFPGPQTLPARRSGKSAALHLI